MGGLENLLKGVGVGAAQTVDLFGSTINYVDMWISGASIADKDRAVPTLAARATQSTFSDYKDPLPFWSGYVPRFFGSVIGGTATAAALAGVGYLASPVVAPLVPAGVYTVGTAALGTMGVGAAAAATGIAITAGALAIPAVLGMYGVARAVGTYAKSFFKGENNDKPKASFHDGFKYGWHGTTHLTDMLSHHDLEYSLTGRGPYDSRIDSSIARSARGMRRNFAAVAGSVAGRFTGAAAIGGLATAGFLTAGPIGAVVGALAMPAYKSVRDWFKTGRNLGRHGTGRVMPAYA